MYTELLEKDQRNNNKTKVIWKYKYSPIPHFQNACMLLSTFQHSY